MSKKHLSNRRNFLRTIGATTVVAGAVGVEPFLQSEQSQVHAAPANRGANQRANECAKLRREAAQTGLLNTPQNLQHPTNSDEDRYPNKIANYSKGLPHNSDGTVVLSAYQALLTAINSGSNQDFNAIPLGGAQKLTNPQAGLAFDMEGLDSHALVQPPPPAFASREQAAEISENYWMALLRDVPFSQYPINPIANAAASDLTSYGTDFKGAKTNGSVTPQTLFEGCSLARKTGHTCLSFSINLATSARTNSSRKLQQPYPILTT